MCSQPCGTATRNQVRTCTEPEPSNGGRSCSGDEDRTEDCNLADCRMDCFTADAASEPWNKDNPLLTWSKYNADPSSPSAESCQLKCQENKLCQWFNYVPRGKRNSGCWLIRKAKTGESRETEYRGWMTGPKYCPTNCFNYNTQSEPMTYVNADSSCASSEDCISTSPEDCQLKCQQDESCEWFNYIPQGLQAAGCWLIQEPKTGESTFTEHKGSLVNLHLGYVTGPKYCGDFEDGACYEDCIDGRYNRDGCGRILEGFSAPHDDLMTVEKCKVICVEKGFAYAGLGQGESGDVCSCGNEVPRGYKKPVQCTTPCQGNSDQICGDHDGSNIYKTNIKEKSCLTANAAYEPLTQNYLVHGSSSWESCQRECQKDRLCKWFNFVPAGEFLPYAGCMSIEEEEPVLGVPTGSRLGWVSGPKYCEKEEIAASEKDIEYVIKDASDFDCFQNCGEQGGLCEGYCEEGGYCCSRNFPDQCPEEVMINALPFYTCIVPKKPEV